MYSLSDIICYPYPGYSSYIAKKTMFIITPRDPNSVSFFWEYLIQHCNVHKLYETLNSSEILALEKLLLLYGHISPTHEEYYRYDFLALEAKTIWIFKYPNGDIFIPLELFKTLMLDSKLSNDFYYFSLLNKLSLKMQHDFAIFIENYHGVYNLISKEKNTLDMALVIYIWLLNLRKRKNHMQPVYFDSYKFPLIKEPVNLWDHLYKYHTHLTPVIQEWYDSIKISKKGLYNTLLSLKGQKTELWDLFANGIYLPIILKKNTSVDNIHIITPKEVRVSEYMNMSTLQSQKIVIPK